MSMSQVETVGTEQHDAPDESSLAGRLAHALAWRCTHQGAFHVEDAPAGARNNAVLWVAQLDAHGNEDGTHELTAEAAELAIAALWQFRGGLSIAVVGRVLVRAIDESTKAVAA